MILKYSELLNKYKNYKNPKDKINREINNGKCYRLKKVKKTINGSYILSNGVIILVDEDVESFLEGTLIFYENVGTKI